MSTELEDADPNDSRVTFVKPPLTFKGTELNPYSLGYKILWFQLVDLKVEIYIIM